MDTPSLHPERGKNWKQHQKDKRRFGNNWSTKKHTVKGILRERQKGLCTRCLLTLDETETVDHVIPISKGGSAELYNMQLLHYKCHRIKDGNIRKRNPVHHYLNKKYHYFRAIIKKLLK